MFRSFCVFCASLLAVTPVLEAQSGPDLRIRLLTPAANWSSRASLLVGSARSGSGDEAQAPASPAQVAPAPKLFIKILDGEGAVNNIKARTAREPVVEVDDENHKPVAGALVAFLSPNSGPGGTFNGQPMFRTVTDTSGRAVGTGFKPNHTSGQFQIEVTATFGAEVAHAMISEINQAGAGESNSQSSVGTTRVGIFGGKALIVIAAAAAAATVGAVVATRGGPPTATISAPTTVTVGATH